MVELTVNALDPVPQFWGAFEQYIPRPSKEELRHAARAFPKTGGAEPRWLLPNRDKDHMFRLMTPEEVNERVLVENP